MDNKDNVVQLGDRYNLDKPRMDLIPWDAIEELALVYGYGAQKYSDRNWEKGLEWNKGCAASLQRHMTAWSMGEDFDEESGLPHDIHMAFNVLALITFRLRQVGLDDRPTPYYEEVS